MKLIQINSTYGVASIGRTTKEMTEFLSNKGVLVYNAIPLIDTGRPDDYKIGSKFGIKAHALLSRITGLQGYWSIYETKKLIKWMDEIKPDVVQLRNLHSNYINISILLNYLAKHKIHTVITLHDCWFFTGKCTYYVPAKCTKWQSLCHDCPLLHIDNVNPTWFFDRTKKQFLDKKKLLNAIPSLTIVGVSKWVSDEAKKSFFKDREIETIYNWVDQEIFYSRNNQDIRDKFNLSNKFVILMVTSFISKVKGYDVLKYLSSHCDDEEKIILVGENKFNLEIPSEVIHINGTNDTDELAQLYSTADVCVNTTKYETFGKVTAEALACGTPVIVFNNTASPELVGDRCGYVIDENNYEKEILIAINKIKSNGKEYYSESCEKFSKDNFSKEINAMTYLNLYKNLSEEKE